MEKIGLQVEKRKYSPPLQMLGNCALEDYLPDLTVLHSSRRARLRDITFHLLERTTCFKTKRHLDYLFRRNFVSGSRANYNLRRLCAVSRHKRIAMTLIDLNL